MANDPRCPGCALSAAGKALDALTMKVVSVAFVFAFAFACVGWAWALHQHVRAHCLHIVEVSRG